MSGTQLRHLRVYLEHLALSGITVWPRPSELWVNGLKIHQYHMTWLAALSLGNSSPALSVLRSRKELLRALQDMEDPRNPRWMCIKRERSKLSNHAYFPETSLKGRPEENALDRLATVLPEEQEHFRQQFAKDLGMYPPRWFAQPYIPQLRYLGEIRVICINGIIVSRVYTTPTNLEDGPEGLQDRGFQTQIGAEIIDPEFIE